MESAEWKANDRAEAKMADGETRSVTILRVEAEKALVRTSDSSADSAGVWVDFSHLRPGKDAIFKLHFAPHTSFCSPSLFFLII
jgi:hypothetical protein